MKQKQDIHAGLVSGGATVADNKVITQGNQLIEGSYDINLAEIRLLWLALSKIDSKNPQPEGAEIVLTAPEYSAMYDLELANSAHQLQSVSLTLGSKPIYTYEWNEHKKRVDAVARYWFSAITYGANKGADITLSFSPKIAPFLYDLKNEFTQMNVFAMAKLDTPFAFRLYSWLSRYRKLDKYKNPKSGVISTEKISIDWMKDRSGLTGKYADFKNFRVRVLDPAVDAINRTTDLTVRYETVTTGRKVTHLVFNYIVEGDKAYIRVKPEPPKLPRRPRVKKGSHGEGEWAKTCLDLVREYEKKLKEYDKKEELPVSYLRKEILYYGIIGNTEAVSYIERLISERKSKRAAKKEEK